MKNLKNDSVMLDWRCIQTVFLDMDGTLLDLNFDNHFWREHVPFRYSEKHGIDLARAKSELFARYRSAEGTMDWYCVDYWTGELGLDIALLKEEVNHLIAIHPYVIEFLDALRRIGHRVVLVTNAHMTSLTLKMDKTRLAGHFDQLICAHDFGVPKEDSSFWGLLYKAEAFDKSKTLLIDDSLPVLDSARRYGIRYLLAVYKPDTQQPDKDIGQYNAIRSFQEIMPQ